MIGAVRAGAIAVCTVAAAVTAFVVYCHTRTQWGGVGFDPGLCLAAGFFACFATGAVAVVLALILLAPIVLTDLGRIARADAGRCWRCGYDLHALADCPECGPPEPGRPRTPPPSLHSRTVMLLGVAVFIASIAAMAAGEAYMCWEEASFRSEAAAACARTGAPSYVRLRWWPAGSSALVYYAETGKVINTG